MLSARWLVRPKQRLSRQWTALSFHFTHHYAARSAPLQSGLPRSSLFYFHLISASPCIVLILSVGHLQLDWAAPACSGARSVPLRVDCPRDCAGLCPSVLPSSRRSASPILSFSPPTLFPRVLCLYDELGGHPQDPKLGAAGRELERSARIEVRGVHGPERPGLLRDNDKARRQDHQDPRRAGAGGECMKSTEVCKSVKKGQDGSG
jgi:hypothetical protein